MKKVLIGIGVLLLVIVAALVAIPLFVDLNDYKPQIAAQVEQATGRKLRIDGPIQLSLLPRVAVTLSDVGLSNAPGGQAKEMVSVKRVELVVEPLPLLSRQLVVDRLIVTEPVVALEVDAQGRPNWQFGPPAAAQQQQQQQQQAPASGGSPLDQIRLGDVRLVNGRISYLDRKANQQQVVEKINLAIALPAIDQPFKADGALTWNAKEVKLVADVANPKALLENRSTRVGARVTSEPVNLSYGGDVQLGPTLTVRGDVDLNVPSVRNLAAWTGNPLQMPGNTLGPLVVKGKLAMQGSRIAFNDASIDLDAIRSKGSFEFDSAGRVPAIKATLDIAMLDLNPYLPPEQPAQAGARPGVPPAGQGQAQPGDWSDAPIDFAPLRSVNADLALSVGGIKVRKIEVGRSALKVALNGGRLNADLTELNLYEGKGRGRIGVDAAQAGPAAVTASFNLENLMLEPLLKAAADTDVLAGRGGFVLEANTRGGTQRQLVSALGGRGNVALKDGALKGIDFVNLICGLNPAAIGQAMSGQTDPNKKTEFSEFGASYTIASGIVTNRDMKMLAPLFRAEGEGTVDLPKRTVNYRAVPGLVASCRGQTGSTSAVGLRIPIVLSGPWHNVGYRLDIDPARLLQSLNPAEVLRNPGEALRGLLPGQGGATAPQTGTTTEPQQGQGGLGGAVRGLLGR